MSSKWQPETRGQFHDLWASFVLKAPDNFRDVMTDALLKDRGTALHPPNQGEASQKAERHVHLCGSDADPDLLINLEVSG